MHVHWSCTLGNTILATPIETNDAVTKCNILHFCCDMWPFCEPHHVSKIAIHTAEGGLESAVALECLNEYKCSMFQ